jgi:hypothetical protein
MKCCTQATLGILSIFPQKWAWLPRHALPNGAHFIDQVVCKVIFIFNVCIVIREPWVKEHSHCLVVVVGCNVPSSVGGQVDMVMELSHREVGRQSDTEPEL